MTGEERRRSPRYAADSAATYRLDPDSAWRSCRIVGVSKDGAAIELYDLGVDETLTARLELELSSPGEDETPVGITAIVRNQHRLTSGQVVVGVEFVLAMRRQRDLLEELVRRRATE